MINPAVADLSGPRTTALALSIAFQALDLTGATFRLQVRVAGDTPGTPLANLTTVATAAAEGIRLVGVTGAGTNAVSTLGVRFNKTTMAAMPAAAEPGDAVELAYDLLITPAGGLEERYMRGRIIVEAGVTV